jgi:CRP/FNR family cyclic AMP-dependent transcriptional regulator
MTKESIEFLKNITPFKELTDSSFQALAGNLETLTYKTGEIVFEAGDEGDSLFIIKKGRVQVFITATDTKEKIVLSTLSNGDYFGEMALITGEPRSAAVETLNDVSILRLDKKGFDKIIKDNPKISLSLSHMLSQRLKSANLKRVETEKFYHSIISPSGSLADYPFFEVLKFCEQNALTGKLKVNHEMNKAEISFLKGNVQAVTMDNLDETEAMDHIMQWKEGNFVIEPSLFSMEEQLSNSPTDEKTPTNVPELLELFLATTFEKLISIIGSQKLDEIVIETTTKLRPFFSALDLCQFQILPKIHIKLEPHDKWTDKSTLAIAVFLQSVLKNCRSSLIGFSFFDIEKMSGDQLTKLKKISFFDYMDHAKEFVV